MKKISLYIEERQEKEIESLLEKYERKADFIRNAIQKEIDKRKEGE